MKKITYLAFCLALSAPLLAGTSPFVFDGTTDGKQGVKKALDRLVKQHAKIHGKQPRLTGHDFNNVVYAHELALNSDKIQKAHKFWRLMSALRMAGGKILTEIHDEILVSVLGGKDTWGYLKELGFDLEASAEAPNEQDLAVIYAGGRIMLRSDNSTMKSLKQNLADQSKMPTAENLLAELEEKVQEQTAGQQALRNRSFALQKSGDGERHFYYNLLFGDKSAKAIFMPTLASIPLETLLKLAEIPAGPARDKAVTELANSINSDRVSATLFMGPTKAGKTTFGSFSSEIKTKNAINGALDENKKLIAWPWLGVDNNFAEALSKRIKEDALKPHLTHTVSVDFNAQPIHLSEGSVLVNLDTVGQETSIMQGLPGTWEEGQIFPDIGDLLSHLEVVSKRIESMQQGIALRIADTIVYVIEEYGAKEEKTLLDLMKQGTRYIYVLHNKKGLSHKEIWGKEYSKKSEKETFFAKLHGTLSLWRKAISNDNVTTKNTDSSPDTDLTFIELDNFPTKLGFTPGVQVKHLILGNFNDTEEGNRNGRKVTSATFNEQTIGRFCKDGETKNYAGGFIKKFKEGLTKAIESVVESKQKRTKVSPITSGYPLLKTSAENYTLSLPSSQTTWNEISFRAYNSQVIRVTVLYKSASGQDSATYDLALPDSLKVNAQKIATHFNELAAGSPAKNKYLHLGNGNLTVNFSQLESEETLKDSQQRNKAINPTGLSPLVQELKPVDEDFQPLEMADTTSTIKFPIEVESILRDGVEVLNPPQEDDKNETVNIAVIGMFNSGKTTTINQLFTGKAESDKSAEATGKTTHTQGVIDRVYKTEKKSYILRDTMGANSSLMQKNYAQLAATTQENEVEKQRAIAQSVNKTADLVFLLIERFDTKAIQQIQQLLTDGVDPERIVVVNNKIGLNTQETSDVYNERFKTFFKDMESHLAKGTPDQIMELENSIIAKSGSGITFVTLDDTAVSNNQHGYAFLRSLMKRVQPQKKRSHQELIHESLEEMVRGSFLVPNDATVEFVKGTFPASRKPIIKQQENRITPPVKPVSVDGLQMGTQLKPASYRIVSLKEAEATIATDKMEEFNDIIKDMEANAGKGNIGILEFILPLCDLEENKKNKGVLFTESFNDGHYTISVGYDLLKGDIYNLPEGADFLKHAAKEGEEEELMTAHFRIPSLNQPSGVGGRVQDQLFTKNGTLLVFMDLYGRQPDDDLLKEIASKYGRTSVADPAATA